MMPLREGVGASTVVLPPGNWLLLIDFLCQQFPAIPRESWAQRMQDGLVCNSDGIPLGSESPYRAHSSVHYYRAVANETRIPFEARILFQDDCLIAVDKPHFLPVMPAGKYLQETLLVRLKRETGIETLSPIHRLDRDTAGIVLFCINPAQRGHYQALFQRRAVRKIYQAIAPNCPDGILPVTRRSRLAESGNFMQMHEVDGPWNAETRVSLLRKGLHNSLYQLEPVTGKKHQLRVHMQALGIPLLNDNIYPVFRSERFDCLQDPLQLLASDIEFTDPISGHKRHFSSQQTLAAEALL